MDTNWNDLFSLEQQYAFYKQNHRNPTNILIHVICDPLTNIPLLSTLSLLALPAPLNNCAALVAVIYTAYNLYIGKHLGLSITPVTMVYYATAVALRDALGTSRTLVLTFVMQYFMWSFLFYSHKRFEGGRPSVTRSLVQAFMAEPILIWLEVMVFFGLMQPTKQYLDKIVAEHKSVKLSE